MNMLISKRKFILALTFVFSFCLFTTIFFIQVGDSDTENCLGDINGDKKIDAYDVNFVSSLFGSVCGDGRYDAKADLNDDCKIDMRDVSIVSRNYGKVCPDGTQTKNDIKELAGNENYTTIIIDAPQFLYQPDKWNRIYKNVDEIKNLLGINIDSKFEGKSIPKILESFDGLVFSKNPKYSTSIILIPKKNYENVTKAFKGLGFKVYDNILLTPHLDVSKNIIKTPYIYGQYGTTQELTGEGVKVAIVDSGIDGTHPDFQPLEQKVIFWNDTTSDCFGCCVDLFGHGTPIAGIIGGKGSVLSKYKGIAPNSELLIWRIHDTNLGGLSLSAASDAIEQASNSDADIISLSCGYSSDQLESMGVSMDEACHGQASGYIQNIYDAIVNALTSGKIVVTSVQNYGPHWKTFGFPACMPFVISVGASHKENHWIVREDLDGSYEIEEKADIRSIITVTTDSPPKVYEEEWEATWKKIGLNNVNVEHVGFQRVIKPNTWPATVRVEVEAQHKNKECYGSEQVWWDPGVTSEGDEYWTWEKTYSYNYPKRYIVVEVGAKASGERKGCFLYDESWDVYYNNYTCTGTALGCDSFDSSRNSCENQIGCGWCGCKVKSGFLWFCKDWDTTECILSTCVLRGYDGCYWEGCEGTPKPCDQRVQSNEWCGNPSTTGCTASWDMSDVVVNMYRTKERLRSAPVFYSSRGWPGLEAPYVTAPGIGICATKSSTASIGVQDCGNNKYERVEGTSFAAPMVTGLVALIKEAESKLGENPDLSEIMAGLSETAEQRVFSGNPDVHEGYGRINVEKAIDYLTDCQIKPSHDTSDSHFKKGYCLDYTVWSSNSCSSTKNYDYCSGDRIHEAVAYGNTCHFDGSTNCKSYGDNCKCEDGKCKCPSGGGGGRPPMIIK